MKDRIYVCHTYYHAYVSFLKEFKFRADAESEGRDPGEATLVLSKMSNDFESFGERAMSTGVFKEVIPFDEKRESFFPELEKYSKHTNFLANTVRRIRKTKRFAKCLEPFIPVDFKEYKDIYVYCDEDPIGTYLSMHRIYYHAMEDGLNSIVNIDHAHFANRTHFGFKAFLSKRLNLIFIQNGYAKYCIDCEVNDVSAIKIHSPYYTEVPRKSLTDRLTEADKEALLKAFIRDIDSLKRQIGEMGDDDKILVLTDPLCTLDVRKTIFEDIIKMYEPEGRVFLKPHPRDVLDYRKEFPGYPMFDATVPMELLNFFPGLHFKKAVGVLTEMKAITFADEAVRLGPDFMDKYEEPSIHRQNEQI